MLVAHSSTTAATLDRRRLSLYGRLSALEQVIGAWVRMTHFLLLSSWPVLTLGDVDRSLRREKLDRPPLPPAGGEVPLEVVDWACGGGAVRLGRAVLPAAEEPLVDWGSAVMRRALLILAAPNPSIIPGGGREEVADRGVDTETENWVDVDQSLL
jgi:hypothetical protein